MIHDSQRYFIFRIRKNYFTREKINWFNNVFLEFCRDNKFPISKMNALAKHQWLGDNKVDYYSFSTRDVNSANLILLMFSEQFKQVAYSPNEIYEI